MTITITSMMPNITRREMMTNLLFVPKFAGFCIIVTQVLQEGKLRPYQCILKSNQEYHQNP